MKKKKKKKIGMQRKEREMRRAEDPNTQRDWEREREITKMATFFKGKRRETRNSSLFSETQKSKPYPSPKIKIQNLDVKEVSD